MYSIPDVRFLLLCPPGWRLSLPRVKKLLISHGLTLSSSGAVWLSSPTWNSVVVLCGSGIAASEELLGSQGLLAEHLELNKDFLCRELEHYKLMNLNTLLCHVYCGS